MTDCSPRLIIKNQFADAAVAVSPAPLAGYPAAHLLMTWRTRVMRTSGLSNQQILFVLPASQTANAFFCPVDGSCTVRLELFADTARATRVYDSGVTKFGVQTEQMIPLGRWEAGIHALGATEGVQVGAARVLYFPEIRYLSARVTLNQPSGAYIEVPYLVIGQAFKPTFGASTGATVNLRNNRGKKRTRGGSLLRTGSIVQWRELSLELRYMPEAERTQLFASLADAGGEGVLIDPYPLNVGDLHDQSLFLADVELPEFTDNASYHATKLVFQEV